MTRVEAVISDFGGVLTSPLLDSFAAFQDSSGISLQSLGQAMAAIAARDGVNPLFELETGRMTEAQFLTSLGEELTTQLGREIELHGFGERYFAHLHPNEQMIDYMRSLRERGHRLAICTNNVREWEPRWRAMLPIDEIFDVVVDSAFRRTLRCSSTTSSSTATPPGPWESAPSGSSRQTRRSRRSKLPWETELGLLGPLWTYLSHPHGRDNSAPSRPANVYGHNSRPKHNPRKDESVLAAQTIPAVQLETLAGEHHAAFLGEPGQDRVERLLLPHAGLERLLATEAGGDFQRLAAVLAE
jgi:hypothetical protein